MKSCVGWKQTEVDGGFEAGPRHAGVCTEADEHGLARRGVDGRGLS